MSKPTIHARNQTGSTRHERSSGNMLANPTATVTVDFTLGDHVWALSQLDQAVADVRRQIEATIPDRPQEVRVSIDGRSFMAAMKPATKEWKGR